MKTLITFLLFFLSINVIAQKTYIVDTKKNCVGYLNFETNQYDYKNYINSKISFVISEKNIEVNDMIDSKYTIIEEIPTYQNGEVEIKSLKCIDEMNRNCVFGIEKKDGKIYSIGIIYDKKMFLYLVD